LEFEGGEIVLQEQGVSEDGVSSEEVLLCEPFNEAFRIELYLANCIWRPWGAVGELALRETQCQISGTKSEADISECLRVQGGPEFVGEFLELVREQDSVGAGFEGEFELFLCGGMAAECERGGFDAGGSNEEFELAEAEGKFGFREWGDLTEMFGDA
jgi:hypothetical protein